MFDFNKIQALHEATKASISIPLDPSTWPDNWKKIEFKEYKRLKRIYLPKISTQGMPSLNEVLKTRSSSRYFNSSELISIETVSSLLNFSAGAREDMKTALNLASRFYPSAGARYPLEIYIALRNIEKIENGIYHYNIKEHALEKILSEKSGQKIRTIISETWARDAQMLIVITSKFGQMLSKYGGRGYRFNLLEAGALMENFYLVSKALGLGCCALGKSIDGEIDEILNLTSEEENTLCLLAVGVSKIQ